VKRWQRYILLVKGARPLHARLAFLVVVAFFVVINWAYQLCPISQASGILLFLICNGLKSMYLKRGVKHICV